MAICEVIAGLIVIVVALVIFSPIIHAIWTLPDHPDKGPPYIL